ncbi:MAG: hypothetical protein NPIRA02_05660 [Nitrospirales bacterium]|nr:MAG: hypothetical protein NPIRA02_05660 [Nitrospirales bacterium]
MTILGKSLNLTPVLALGEVEVTQLDPRGLLTLQAMISRIYPEHEQYHL